jgi:hypothetical protein
MADDMKKGLVLPMVSSSVTVVANREVDGIEMGVLSDGTPFLGARGLARICGVAASVIIEWANEWSPSSTKPRDRYINEILASNGVTPTHVFTSVVHEGRTVSAFPDWACMAVLEYYAFEQKREAAITAFRTLARRSLREFIYTALGYDPAKVVPPAWRDLQERLTLNKMPKGYFSVFQELAELMMSAMQHGLAMDHQSMPDISVGQIWARHWADNKLERLWGPRAKYPHKFPDWWPQSQVEPECWAYPLSALGSFRIWLQEIYLPEKYPKYMQRKVKEGALDASRATLLLAAVNREDGEDEEN